MSTPLYALYFSHGGFLYKSSLLSGTLSASYLDRYVGPGWEVYLLQRSTPKTAINPLTIQVEQGSQGFAT